MNIYPYISLARVDNWTKNLLMFAGIGLAYVLNDVSVPADWLSVFYVLLSLCLASSANYVLNEAIDAQSDAFHPLKKSRAAVKYHLSKKVITAEYMLLALSALLLSSLVHSYLFYTICFYIICAWAYNIPPVRLKDKAYFDVLLEAINYPIRILLGWMCVTPDILAPSSLLIIAWSVGAFAMSLKRLAEFQLFESKEKASQYRKSYANYGFDTLAISSFAYGLFVIFGFTVFMMKYKIELLLSIPLFVVWMSWYFLMGIRKHIFVIYPEKLAKNKEFVVFSIIALAIMAVLMQSNIPAVHLLDTPALIDTKDGR